MTERARFLPRAPFACVQFALVAEKIVLPLSSLKTMVCLFRVSARSLDFGGTHSARGDASRPFVKIIGMAL